MKYGTIYKITNDINCKVYIGQTTQDLRVRFNRHMRQSKKSNTHFYNAVRKYGKEHFSIEVIEANVPKDLLDERERYWISEYYSFNKGYNSTHGGEGVDALDYSEVSEYWDDGKSVAEIAELTSISMSSICCYLRSNKPDYAERHKKMVKNANAIKVSQYDLFGNYIATYDSLTKAHEATGDKISRISKCINNYELSTRRHQWRSGCSTDNIGKARKSAVMGRQVEQYTSEWEYIKTFNTVQEAADELLVTNSAIRNSCNKCSLCKNFHFVFKEEN